MNTDSPITLRQARASEGNCPGSPEWTGAQPCPRIGSALRSPTLRTNDENSRAELLYVPGNSSAARSGRAQKSNCALTLAKRATRIDCGVSQVSP
jgi:hypothetical protein